MDASTCRWILLQCVYGSGVGRLAIAVRRWHCVCLLFFFAFLQRAISVSVPRARLLFRLSHWLLVNNPLFTPFPFTHSHPRPVSDARDNDKRQRLKIKQKKNKAKTFQLLSPFPAKREPLLTSSFCTPSHSRCPPLPVSSSPDSQTPWIPISSRSPPLLPTSLSQPRNDEHPPLPSKKLYFYNAGHPPFPTFASVSFFFVSSITCRRSRRRRMYTDTNPCATPVRKGDHVNCCTISFVHVVEEPSDSFADVELA